MKFIGLGNMNLNRILGEDILEKKYLDQILGFLDINDPYGEGIVEQMNLYRRVSYIHIKDNLNYCADLEDNLIEYSRTEDFHRSLKLVMIALVLGWNDPDRESVLLDYSVDDFYKTVNEDWCEIVYEEDLDLLKKLSKMNINQLYRMWRND